MYKLPCLQSRHGVAKQQPSLKIRLQHVMHTRGLQSRYGAASSPPERAASYVCGTCTEQAWWQPADRRGAASDGVPHVQSRRGGVTEHRRGPFCMYCMTLPSRAYEVVPASPERAASYVYTPACS
jgi:hypothetical protein